MKTSLDLKLNFNCNANCTHCFISDRRHSLSLSFDEIMKSIDKLPANSIVILTGGEPTIRDDFLDILKYVKSKDHTVVLQTNGLKFSDLDFAEKCKSYIDETLMTLHSHVPSIHNSIMRSDEYKDTFRFSIKAMENLYKLNYNFSTQTVISNYNIKTLPETYDFLQNHFPGIHMHLTYPHTVGSANGSNTPTYSEAYPYINKILESWHDLIIPVYIPMCYLYPYQYKTDYTNLEYDIDYIISAFCLDKSVSGELIDLSLMKSNSFVKIDKCNDCIFNNKCKGTWQNYVDIFGKFDVNPIKQLIEPDIRTYTRFKINDANFDELKAIKNKYEIILYYEARNDVDFIRIINQVKDLNFKKIEIIPVNLNHEQTKNIVLNILEEFSVNTKTAIILKDIPYCITGNYYDFIKNDDNFIKKEKILICNNCILSDQCKGISNNLDKNKLIQIMKKRKLKTLKEIYEDVLFLAENHNSNNVSVKLDTIIKDVYLFLRNDHLNIDIIFTLLSELYSILKSNKQYKQIPEFYNRLLSLIALKNDMILQHNLKKEYIDKYLQEILFIIKSDRIYDHHESPIKVLETFSKINIAYSLLGYSSSIGSVARAFISKLNLDGYFVDEAKLLQLSENDTYVFDTFVLYYYYFNISMLSNEEFIKHTENEIWLELYHYKMIYYKLSQEEVFKKKGYNFIWK